MPDDADTRPLQASGDASSDGWVLGGRYRVIERVGTGGMSEVFRAHDDLLDRDVATKVFRTLLDDPDGSTNGATRRELELQAMARLNHPNLITLYDGSVSGDGPAYLVLEFVDGPDLANRLKEGPLPEAEVRAIGAEIADALAYVHAHGLVHRDVKPANILLGSEHGLVRARLSDFGIVRMMGSPQMTSADLTMGTAYYIAPEQARGSSVGPEADVYALGLVLLEALTGVRAFDGPMHEALAARLTTSPEIPAGLPAPGPALLRAMTEREPAARPDAATVARQLRTSMPTGSSAGAASAPVGALLPAEPAAAAEAAATAALAAPAAAAVAGEPAPKRRRRLRPALLLAVAALVAAAAVALGAFLLPSDPAGVPAGTESTAPPTHPRSSATHRRTTAPAANVGNQPVKDKGSPTAAKKRTRTAQRSTRPAAPVAGSPSTSVAPASTSSAPASSSSTPAPSTPPAQQSSTTSGAAAGDPSGSTTAAGQ